MNLRNISRCLNLKKIHNDVCQNSEINYETLGLLRYKLFEQLLIGLELLQFSWEHFDRANESASHVFADNLSPTLYSNLN